MLQEIPAPQWVQDFKAQEFLANSCIVSKDVFSFNLLEKKQKIPFPLGKGIYFIFGNYYTPEDRTFIPDEQMRWDYTEEYRKFLGISTVKEFANLGVFKIGLVRYPQSVAKDSGLVYVGRGESLRTRLKRGHSAIDSIRKNALAIPHPFQRELKISIKVIDVDDDAHLRIFAALEREIINQLKPPFNDQGSLINSDNPFAFCDRLSKIKPIPLVPSDITHEFISELVDGSDERMRNRMLNSMGIMTDSVRQSIQRTEKYAEFWTNKANEAFYR